MVDMHAVTGLTALYFPETYIPEEVLKPVLFFFDGIVVYQPSEWRPSPMYSEIAQTGLLKIETPVPAAADLPALKRTVRELLSWGDQVFTSGDFGYLKRVEPPILPEGQTEIMAALRGEEIPGHKIDKTAAARIFLHLAQEFDQRQDEMHLMNLELAAKERKLWSDILIDAEATVHPAFAADVPEEEQSISASMRLIAWSQLFQDHLGAGRIPLTTQSAVMGLLPPHHLLSTIRLPDLTGWTVSEVLQLHRDNITSESREAARNRIRELLQLSGSTPWTASSEGPGQEILVDAPEAPGRESAPSSSSTPYSLSLYIFPGVPTAAICSAEKGGHNENGFAVLLTKEPHESV